MRLGYDPRSTTASKVYQCMDYRMPKNITAVSTLESKKSKDKFRAGVQNNSTLSVYTFYVEA